MNVAIARNIVATIATKKHIIRRRDVTLVNTIIAKKKEQ
jgi:hypothetical protein